MRRVLIPLLVLLAACATSSPSPEQEAPALAAHAHPVTGATGDYDALIAATGPAALVLLGEATHGTHEFYRERARLTQRLIVEKGFRGLALEADWADASRVDRYVRGDGTDRTAEEALGSFTEFPRWMWRNGEFLQLVQWLRNYNDSLPPGAVKVGVYGLDLYGLAESIDAVVQHLEAVNPAAANEARRRYRCFAPYDNDPDRYGEAAARAGVRACTREAKEELAAVRALLDKAPVADKRLLDELFAAEQNARVVQNGEEFYRQQVLGQVSTWNLRDRHMVATMDAVQRYLLRRNGRDHIVVWAHNSHVGDARATAHKQWGEWNMGQLVREHWRRELSYTVGFSTDTGTVIAASVWGAEPQRKALNPSLRGSHGAILHEVGLPSFYILLKEVESALVKRPRSQRAVGVIYLPATERESHYFTATLREQFDAVVHIDRTTAVTPLDPVR
jgi:erythromycin esterase-like protein